MLMSAPNDSRMRRMTLPASKEWPPSAKKSSSMPTRGSPSASANSAQSISSCGVRGPRPAAACPESGIGSALRSIFLFGVKGMASSMTIAAGTI